MSLSGKPALTIRAKSAGESGRTAACARPEIAGVIEHPALDRPLGPAEGNGADEVEISLRLDQRQEHAGRGGIGNDPLNLGDGEVPARVPDLAGLEIDDPVADARLGPAEVLRGELIALSRDVVVD